MRTLAYTLLVIAIAGCRQIHVRQSAPGEHGDRVTVLGVYPYNGAFFIRARRDSIDVLIYSKDCSRSCRGESVTAGNLYALQLVRSDVLDIHSRNRWGSFTLIVDDDTVYTDSMPVYESDDLCGVCRTD